MIEDITLKNLKTGLSIHINKDTTQDYVLGDVDLGTIQASHNTASYPNQIGSSITNTILGTRNITISGWVIGTKEEITARKKVLNGFINPQQQIQLEYSSYVLIFNPTTTISYGTTEETNNYAMSKFQIEGLCSDPLFHANEDTYANVASIISLFHFPLIINESDQTPPQIVMGYRSEDFTTKINNEGSVSTGVKFVITTENSSVVNPSIINVNTQEYFKINKEILLGEKVEINTTIGERSIKGYLNGKEINYFKYKDIDSSWLQLDQGINLLRYQADSGLNNLIIDVYFNNKYLEVEECL